MNSSELAAKMLEWESKRKDLDSLESEIKQAVLEIGKTQTVGNVRASYTKGRVTSDYKGACSDLSQEELKPFEKIDYDYKKACEEYKLDVLTKAGEPSVSLKLM